MPSGVASSAEVIYLFGIPFDYLQLCPSLMETCYYGTRCLNLLSGLIIVLLWHDSDVSQWVLGANDVTVIYIIFSWTVSCTQLYNYLTLPVPLSILIFFNFIFFAITPTKVLQRNYWFNANNKITNLAICSLQIHKRIVGFQKCIDISNHHTQT